MQSRDLCSALLAVSVMAWANPVLSAGPLDGVYAGTATLTTNKSGNCTASANRSIHITDGHAALAYNNSTTLVGEVQPDGSLTMTGSGTTLSGKITGSQFTGTSDNSNCSYKFALTRS